MRGRPLRTVGIVGVLVALVALPFAAPPNTATAPPAWGAFLPDGGETLPGGSYYDIQWQATHDTDGTLFVTLSLVPGGFVTAGEFPTGSASWAWQVPTANLPAERIQACAVAYDGSRGCRESSASFAVSMAPPYIGLLSPSDGGENVSLDAPIVLVFDPPPDTTSTTWTVSPAIPWIVTWSSGDTILFLMHSMPFAECTTYAMMVTDGPRSLSFSFTTLCPAPRVLDYGLDPSLGGSIWISFNKPMDRLENYASINPLTLLTPTWTADNTYLVLRPPPPGFFPCTTYTVLVNGGKDMFGNPGLVVSGPAPNPFSFTTECSPPYIVSTSPGDGSSGVPIGEPIVVTFSEPMNWPSLVWSILPAVAAQLRFQPDVLTIEPQAPYGECTEYTVEIVSAEDMDGVPLAQGPVPNPWSFTVACPPPPAPRGLGVSPLPPGQIRIAWSPVPVADLYRVYESSDRFAPWPWGVLGETPGPSFDADHLRDGQVHFYIVRAVARGVEGPNSTMGVKAEISLTFSAVATNVAWISLPYDSAYRQGSDVSNDLSPGGIDVVGKWDPARQSTILWYHLRSLWRGEDFTIGPGDGLFIGSVATRSWPIVGTDRTATLSFRPNPSPMANVNWISLPWTNAYKTAREIVVDIEGSTGPTANTRIVEVGTWDSSSQQVVVYQWTPAGWAGSDFSVPPGSGIYLRVVAPFDWEPRLLQVPVP